MSVIVLWENIKKDKYILEIDKKLFEEMEDFLFWKILEEAEKEDDTIVTKEEVFDLINKKINEVKNK